MADRSFLYAIIGHKNEIRKSIKKTVPMSGRFDVFIL